MGNRVALYCSYCSKSEQRQWVGKEHSRLEVTWGRKEENLVIRVGGFAMTKGIEQIGEGKRREKEGRKEVPFSMCGPCAAKNSM